MGAATVAAQLAKTVPVNLDSIHEFKHDAMSLNDHKPFQTEIEINDFHQSVRWRIIKRDILRIITENLGVVVVVRGKYYRQTEILQHGERKLYLLLEGQDEVAVKQVKQKIRQLIEEQVEKAICKDE